MFNSYASCREYIDMKVFADIQTIQLDEVDLKKMTVNRYPELYDFIVAGHYKVNIQYQPLFSPEFTVWVYHTSSPTALIVHFKCDRNTVVFASTFKRFKGFLGDTQYWVYNGKRGLDYLKEFCQAIVDLLTDEDI